MQPKHPWLQKCIQKLEELPQIETTTTIEPFLENTLADGLLTIYTPHNQVKYLVEIKASITLDTVDANINGNKNQPKYNSSEPVADPLLIHAELSLNPDTRLKETS
jgi:hypothetical protein